MRKKRSHIALALILLCNFLFIQIVSNFFHNHGHEENVIPVIEKVSFSHSTLTFEKIPAECPICSMDIFHELFYHDLYSLLTHESKWVKSSGLYVYQDFFLSIVYITGRAPPAIFNFQ